jgi:AAA+ superfamily predicted ATPase
MRYVNAIWCPSNLGSLIKRLSVAEEMRQPLYMVNASELGETVTEVEESLGRVLELANKWNAILLLDECDLYLEARSIADIRRSHLVSSKFDACSYGTGVHKLSDLGSIPATTRVLPGHYVSHE